MDTRRKNRVASGLLMLAVILTLVGCGGGKQGAGYQHDSQPIAKASVLDAGYGDDAFTVRSGTDILLSGKDSDGIDDPILNFKWTVISSSTTAYSLTQLQSMLVERTSNTKLFRVPTVTEPTQVVFELSIRDADGKDSTDTVAINIVPVGDTDTYLLQGAVGNNLYNQYELVVALALEPGEVTASDFEVLVETLVEWQPRTAHADCSYGKAGNFCQMLTKTQTISGTWPAGLTYAQVVAQDPVTATFNPHFYITVPQLDLNEINKHFETANRDKRLELHRAESAQVKQRFSFVSAGNTAKLIILDPEGMKDSGLLALPSTATGSSEIDVNDLRQRRALEGLLTAQIYYQLIDPTGSADTLSKWLASRGFNSNTASEPDFAHAIYLNNYDLGFGRDMYMRKDACGNVYSYVENYPTLDAAIQKRNHFATVVMEYSALEGEPGNGESCSSEPKFVKFFAYVPDTTTGTKVRMANMNFDGRGEKYLPGVCTACHGGTPFNLTAFAQDLPLNANVADVVAALSDADKLKLADLNATFMPFDLDSFLYTQASNAKDVAPSINPDNFTEAQLKQYSKADQAAAMRTFNKNVLHTYLTSLAQLAGAKEEERERWYAPIELINSWYHTNITNAQALAMMDTASFDGLAVLPGWQGNEDLYHDVFARHCRSCHIQASNTERNFSSIDKFLKSDDPDTFKRIENEVFNLGRMPMARLTADRLWVNFDGGESAAAKLQAYMNINKVPGAPIADFTIDNETPEDVGVRVTMDARFASSLALTYNWSIVSDCGNTPAVSGGNTAVASFVVEQSPCKYTVKLGTENLFGADEISKMVLADKIPESVNFDALLDDGTYGYTPGDSALTIDIDSFILSRGDNDLSTPMTVIVNDPADSDLTPHNNLTNNNNGTVTLGFSALAGVETTFDYKVEDFNGSRSARGVVSVAVPQILPQLLAPLTVTSTSARIAWTVPAGFVADGYTAYRDDAPYDGIYQRVAGPLTTLSYTDSSLLNNADYRYQVSALLDGVESARSNMIVVSTTDGVPSGVTASAASTTSIALSWNINPLDAPTGYRIFENLGATHVAQVTNKNYTRTGLTPNTQYTYQVAAVFSNDVSEKSTTAQARTLTAVPTALAQVEASRTTSTIRLQWADNANGGAPSYDLRCDASGGTQSATTTSLARTFSALPSNTTYSCRVRALGSATNSAYTSNVSVRTKVSYADTVKPQIADAQIEGQSCQGCHVSHTAQFVRDSLRTHNCFSSANSATYGSCISNVNPRASSMLYKTITDAQIRTNLANWRSDGGPD